MLIVVSVRAQCSADCAFVPFEWISPVIGCSLELVVLSDTRYVSRELYLFSIRDSGGLGRLEWEWNGQAGMGTYSCQHTDVCTKECTYTTHTGCVHLSCSVGLWVGVCVCGVCVQIWDGPSEEALAVNELLLMESRWHKRGVSGRGLEE